MDYLAGCYRQQSEKAVSLLLQQYQWGKVHMIFACVCGSDERGKEGGKETEEAGSYMTRQLLKWFRGLEPKKLARNLEKGILSLAESLRERLLQIDQEWKSKYAEGEVCPDLAGIFCLECNYLLFCRGQAGIYLINTAFGHGHVRRLDKRGSVGGFEIEQGVLQQDIGLLCATESFFDQVTEKMLSEGLFMGEEATEEQLEKHVRELAGEGERRGGKGIGVIFMKTVSTDFSV